MFSYHVSNPTWSNRRMTRSDFSLTCDFRESDLPSEHLKDPVKWGPTGSHSIPITLNFLYY